ncbi:hypothetical protein ATX81_09180 [Oenococcus oeni]|uniref:hypothetical protein n=1 Tax=Oenococcus oeni TaxID=1247 RepID=UPI000277B676|nr:hypothetical protein [Oenococcus oeni]EJO02406.1 hypothetical protein AWRIB318_420 [Oenococcus oeni AWRIB318]EKP89545.1 hypothetical protein AWRIB202_1182 [Oenococcus oeni AWRIB202]OIK65179.1 hypothetical protein ATW64_03170 [Oenococcus oeni]OIK72520.1 hypothetical protein ATW71_09640 [Oenococcus oeni]OIK75856.1 hypothetical protein ATW72_09430 [Oenococcus oeni]
MMQILTVISTSVTAATAIISIVISVITLRRSKKIQESDSRPYISGFLKTVELPKETSAQFLTIQNFGKTSATIKEISLSEDAKKIKDLIPAEKRFDGLKNFVLAPNQKVSFITYRLENTPLKKEISNDQNKITEINIKYIDQFNKNFEYKGKLNFRFGEMEGYLTTGYNFSGSHDADIKSKEQIATNLEDIRQAIYRSLY